jgi:glutaconate CoA-transferase subunit A
MAAAYTAGASHLPFGMLRGYLGTDLNQVNPEIQSVTCPYTGTRLATVPALHPDVTILHAQKADRRGNVLLHGIVGAGKEAALAADKLLVTVEEVVDDLGATPNAVILPHWVITAIACVPWGAYPSYAQGCYERDNAFYLDWEEIARDRETFVAWMELHVLSTRDHVEFLKSLSRVAAEAP